MVDLVKKCIWQFSSKKSISKLATVIYSNPIDLKLFSFDSPYSIYFNKKIKKIKKIYCPNGNRALWLFFAFGWHARTRCDTPGFEIRKNQSVTNLPTHGHSIIDFSILAIDNRSETTAIRFLVVDYLYTPEFRPAHSGI